MPVLSTEEKLDFLLNALSHLEQGAKIDFGAVALDTGLENRAKA